MVVRNWDITHRSNSEGFFVLYLRKECIFKLQSTIWLVEALGALRMGTNDFKYLVIFNLDISVLFACNTAIYLFLFTIFSL